MADFERFFGTWELAGIEDSFEGKSGPAPGFEKAVGLLLYLPSGEMSVHFSATSRTPFLREFSPSPSELTAAGTAYGGYAGSWLLEEESAIVVHLPEVSFVPNRVGRRVRRSYSFKEDLLLLRPLALFARDPAPARVLTWKRRSHAKL